MREEKEQLRLEKERIEREKHRLVEDKETSRGRMNLAMRDNLNKRITAGVNSAHKDITDMVHDKSNLTRRPYKDIEGEMDDYERFHEDEHEDETPDE